jgi:hypothetical protein
MRRTICSFILLALVSLIMPIRCFANVVVDLHVEYNDANSLKGPILRIPPKQHYVEWDEDQIFFPTLCMDCVLTITEVNANTTVFSTSITADVDTVKVPTLQTGSYKICFEGNYLTYCGYVSF